MRIMKMFSPTKTLGLVSVLAISNVQAGPIDSWRAKRADFRAVLIEDGHEGWCDWARFSMLTMMSYTAAEQEGERRRWTAGQVNAFRHAIWQYQLARAFGQDTAQAIGDVQENGSADPKDSAIDQYNNQAARAMWIMDQQGRVVLGQAIRTIVRSVEHDDGRFITNQTP